MVKQKMEKDLQKSKMGPLGMDLYIEKLTQPFPGVSLSLLPRTVTGEAQE